MLDGIGQDSEDSKWNLNLIQNNDVYIDIIKNKNYGKEEIIDKVIIDNFNIEDEPRKGEIQIYRPDSESLSFTNKEEYKVENEIQYKGAEKSDLNDLKIANQGGLIILRFVNENLGNYKTDEEEIIHDGTLLSKIGLTDEDIQFRVSFDISIELNSGKKYKANINVQMPTGNLIGDGTTNKQINGSEIIFKRY